jgi:hypothetical protein
MGKRCSLSLHFRRTEWDRAEAGPDSNIHVSRFSFDPAWARTLPAKLGLARVRSAVAALGLIALTPDFSQSCSGSPSARYAIADLRGAGRRSGHQHRLERDHWKSRRLSERHVHRFCFAGFALYSWTRIGHRNDKSGQRTGRTGSNRAHDRLQQSGGQGSLYQPDGSEPGWSYTYPGRL